MDHKLLMSLRRDPDIKASLVYFFRSFPLSFTQLQIIIYRPMKILYQTPGIGSLIRDQGTNPHYLSEKNPILLVSFLIQPLPIMQPYWLFCTHHIIKGR